jgi:hypothetical protein
MRLEDLAHLAQFEAEDWREFQIVIEMNGIRTDVIHAEFSITEDEGLVILS